MQLKRFECIGSAFNSNYQHFKVEMNEDSIVETLQFYRNLQSLLDNKQTAFHEMVKNIYPLGKIGSAEDIGKPVTFLASNQASWIQGQYSPSTED